MKRRVTKADAEMAELVANPVLTETDHRLFNGKQLVEELGVKYDFWKDMRLAGFIPPISGLTTLTYAREWINRHPNFREDARILKLSKKPKLAVSLPRQAAGKSGSLRLMRGERRSAQLPPRILLESAA
jgi:hypothetical protein